VRANEGAVRQGDALVNVRNVAIGLVVIFGLGFGV
jgi:hypothetical protein